MYVKKINYLKYKKVTMYIIFIIIIIILMCIYIYKQTNKQNNKQHIKALIRQTARWAVASQQDTSPMIAVLHANYASGYLQALQTIATENEIMQETDLDILKQKVIRIQDRAVKKLVKACPQYLGEKIDRSLAIMGIN